MTRQRLPNRRPGVTEAIYFPWPAGTTSHGEPLLGALGRKLFITAGVDPATGRVREVFARGGSKHGEEIDSALDAVAIEISRRLQRGVGLLDLAAAVPGDLAAKLAPLRAGEGVESFARRTIAAQATIGAILHRLIQIECAITLGDMGEPKQ